MSFSRREFLKLGGLAAAAVVARPFRLPTQKSTSLLGRVTYQTVSVFDAPRLDANTLGYRSRDTILDIEYPLTPFTGPAYNPRWYRLSDGYVHSAWIQPVAYEFNEPVTSVPEKGQVFRVTVPFTRPYKHTQQNGWQPEDLFYLYYHSNHWVTDVLPGPDGKAWYQITEPWERVQYYAAARDLQAISDSEFDPISPDVPASKKRIEISLGAQQLAAYEGEEMVLRIPISSGISNLGAGGLPTKTPTGNFNIYSKLPTKYMGDNRLTDTLSDRFLTGVPWVMFFIEGGYAIHGAYWHNNFGAPMSRGCINVRPDHAQWLYRWTTPVAGPSDWEKGGYGTRVIVS